LPPGRLPAELADGTPAKVPIRAPILQDPAREVTVLPSRAVIDAAHRLTSDIRLRSVTEVDWQAWSLAPHQKDRSGWPRVSSGLGVHGGGHRIRRGKPVTEIDGRELARADDARVASFLSAARSATAQIGWNVGLG
jgi:hypothetical protein